MTPTECLYVRLANGLDEERTVYAYLAGDDLAPNECLDEHGRDVPDDELPPDFWECVIAHVCDAKIRRQVCFINL